MSEINEIQQWEDGIPFITRSDKVEGGNAGKINIQTRILANRTRYLKNQLEAYNGLVKSGELPFSDFETAQEFIDAGKIPAGSLFSVRSDNPDYWVDECVNRNGKVTATGKHLLSESAITARINMDDNGNITFHKDADGLSLIVVDDTGGMHLTGVKGTVQERLNIVGKNTSPAILRLTDAENAAFASVDEYGHLRLPGMPDSVQERLDALKNAWKSSVSAA